MPKLSLMELGKVDKLSDTGFQDIKGLSKPLETTCDSPDSSCIANKLSSFHPNLKLSHPNLSSAINRHKLLLMRSLYLPYLLSAVRRWVFLFLSGRGFKEPAPQQSHMHFFVRILMTNSKYIRDRLQLEK